MSTGRTDCTVPVRVWGRSRLTAAACAGTVARVNPRTEHPPLVIAEISVRDAEKSIASSSAHGPLRNNRAYTSDCPTGDCADLLMRAGRLRVLARHMPMAIADAIRRLTGPIRRPRGERLRDRFRRPLGWVWHAGPHVGGAAHVRATESRSP